MQDLGFELPRIPVPKLFGKSDWASNRDSEGCQKGTKEARSAASCRQKTQGRDTFSYFPNSFSTTVLVHKARIGPVRGLGPQKGRNTPLGTSGTSLDRGRQS
jgi:hypothetical protein